MISEFSFLFSVLFVNITFVIVAILRQQTSFLIKYSTRVLLLLTVLGLIRMMLPLDFKWSVVIPSIKILPFIQAFLSRNILQGNINITFGKMLVGIWVAGSVVVFVNLVKTLWQELQIRRGYSISDDTQARRTILKLGISSARIIVSPDVDMAKMTGVLKAHIYLPEIYLTDNELEYVIRHELQHFKSNDILLKIFYHFLVILFWWNPIVHIFRKELDRLLELRCDTKTWMMRKRNHTLRQY